ncbi:cytochrome c oxidase subunit II [Hymenobacter weizhouensis]|uniref:cytochrome c oxidase subunit II n=1 Tax=Hymenobacter sp. YIM 151500-1 TaxID=2987689 RepID=UPI0022273483|nr:cytochrome c oxidase subunit II [Hymenobacter sp. YIM 151500-1]UYZ63316.1 cytochrome c oxidase subunit II [Hymenobacter sp. YIM 151500-1]
MTALGIVLVLVLLLIVFGLLFRLQILTSIFSGSFTREVGVSNRVNAILFLIFLVAGGAAFAWSFVDSYDAMIVPIASVHGYATERMFWTTMIILGIVFVLTQVLLFVYSYKYQHKEGRRAFFFPHNNKIEIIWTLIPAIVMAALVFAGWKEWSRITGPAPKDAVVVEVMGKQFNWLVRYPGRDQKLGVVNYRLIDAVNEFGFDLSDQNGLDDFTVGEVHVPKGHPVLLKIRSRDVLHAVYMPHFRVQMYAVPGMPTKFWFTPTKTTDEMRAQTGNPKFNYELACNQICGRGHFAMKLNIVVDEPDDYVAWFAQQKPFAEQNPEVLANFKQKATKMVEKEAAAVVPATANASL